MTDQTRQDYSTPKTNAAWIESFDRQKEDILWCWEQPEILERYANRVLILHHRQIIGVGRDYLEARQEAERQCQEQHIGVPPLQELVFVPIPERVELDPFFFSRAVPTKARGE